MRSYAIAAMGLLALTTLGNADPESPKSGKPDKNDPDRMICRKQVATGSRLSATKRCLTAKEWEAIAKLDQESLQRTQQSSR